MLMKCLFKYRWKGGNSMLKKLVVFSVFCFLGVTGAMADIVVDAEGKVQKYPDGSTLNVSAAKNIYTEYFGFKAFIPKGERISMRFSDKDENRMVYCSGNNFNNVKIGDTFFSTDKNTAFAISQDGNLKVEKGSLVVKDKDENVAILSQGNTYRINMEVPSSESFIVMSEPSEESYEQIQKDIVLSPSAPRN